MQTDSLTDNERTFFARMLDKESEEQPTMVFDVIMDAPDNDDHLFIVKQYSSEYKIGVKDKSQKDYKCLDILPTSLSEALSCDLYELIGHHVSLHEWLRERDYQGINYDYPWEE